MGGERYFAGGTVGGAQSRSRAAHGTCSCCAELPRERRRQAESASLPPLPPMPPAAPADGQLDGLSALQWAQVHC